MIKFGVQLWQEEYDFNGLKRAWREVEDMGYDSAWIYDHFYPMAKNTSNNIMESWTLLPSLAAETKRLRLGVLVTCNSYRFPSILAKIAATVDVISKGRLEFGIGAGWYEEEYIAYGIPFPNVKTRIEQLAESVEIIKRIWTQDKTDFHGKYYAINNLISYPKSIQKPYPPIWIGGKNNRLLKIVAEHADYANFAGCSVDKYCDRLVMLKKQCLKVRRPFKDISKTWHGRVIIVDKKEKLKQKVLKAKESTTYGKVQEMSYDQYLEEVIAGTPEQCIEKMQEFIDLGVIYFIPHFPFGTDLKELRIFMDKVASSYR